MSNKKSKEDKKKQTKEQKIKNEPKVKPEEKTSKKEEVHDNTTQEKAMCNPKCCCKGDGKEKCCHCCCCCCKCDDEKCCCKGDDEKKCCCCCCCRCCCCMYENKKKCCQPCCALRMACSLGMILITILFAVGFVFYLIIRDDPTVTFELCKTDVNKCLSNIYQAVKPYSSPYALINYLHAKGYVN